MSILLEATYSKKLGLPNFSSHSFMISVRAEVSSLRRVDAETSRLYRILQESVDRQVAQVGYLPDATKYGMLVAPPVAQNGSNGNGTPTNERKALPCGDLATPVGGNGASSDKGHAAASGTGSAACSEKQKALIEKVAKEQKFTADDLDGIADRLFKMPLERLNRKQTSEFISELLAIAGPPRFRNGDKRPAVSTESR